jgi:hypothetical protein
MANRLSDSAPFSVRLGVLNRTNRTRANLSSLSHRRAVQIAYDYRRNGTEMRPWLILQQRVC